MRDSRKKINKDAIISWIIDGKTVKKSYNERLKEVRSQAYQKTRDGDVIRACGYSTKGDGSIKASARVETKDAELETILLKFFRKDPESPLPESRFKILLCFGVVRLEPNSHLVMRNRFASPSFV